jgi:hypothetical protein
MLKRDPLKPSRCKVCRGPFQKRNMTHKVCSAECAQALALAVRNQAERKAAAAERVKDRAKKESLKTRSDHIKAAQVAFNAYVRARDSGKPCICCGKPLDDPKVGGGFDCGHYRSVGSAPHLRFDERNAHGQTKQCNRYGAGRAVDYRLGLIARIGQDEVDAIEQKQDGGKWTIPELIAIRATYKAKLKQLRESACP